MLAHLSHVGTSQSKLCFLVYPVFPSDMMGAEERSLYRGKIKLLADNRVMVQIDDADQGAEITSNVELSVRVVHVTSER